MNNDTSKQIVLSVLGVAILIVAVVGISYAIFNFTSDNTAENTLSTGTVYMQYEEPENALVIENAMPTETSTGKTLTKYFDFTVKADITGVTTINYDVTAKKVDVAEGETEIPTDKVMLYLEKEVSGSYTQDMDAKAWSPLTADTATGAKAGEMLLTSGSFANTTGTTTATTFADKYRLRMWLKEDATIDATKRTFKVQVNVYAKNA